MSGMSKDTIPKILKSIIRQRKFLIREKKSGRNDLLCFNYIKKLSNYVQAYEGKWSDEAWKRFVLNHVSEIIYLIPDNKSGLTIKKKIYESI